MLHAILEFSPVVLGVLAGLIDRISRLSPLTRIAGLLLIGVSCSFFAGELQDGALEAATCIAIDTSLAAAGWLIARVVLKRLAGARR